MSSVGETLRRERLRRELSLEQISRETKISARLLEAIENEEFDRLPGGVFAKSFARQYARYLGLDEEEAASEVEKAIHPEADLPSFATPPERAFKVPRVTEWDSGSRSNSSMLPALAAVVTVMLVCSAVYAWWQRSHRTQPAAQTRPVAQAPAPAPATQPPVSSTAAAPVEAKPAETPAETPVQPDATQPETAPAAGTEPANPAATLHVSLQSDAAEVWVQAWADGKSVLIATLRPGVVKNVDAMENIRVRTGNAGYLQMTVNGKPAGEIGPKGQIRVVEVTSKGVQILPVVPKSTPAVPDPL